MSQTPQIKTDPMYVLLRDEKIADFNKRKAKGETFDLTYCDFRGINLKGMDADNIDEAAYEAFQKATEQAGSSSQHTMLASLGVVSKGLNLRIDKLSVDKIAIKDSGLMDGFDHKIDIVIKEDDQLVQKMQIAPMSLMQNIDIDAKLKFASAFYAYMKTRAGNLAIADAYVKQEGGNAVFDILLQDGKITVNGQSL